MPKIISKYTLNVQTTQTLVIPQGSVVLSVQAVDNILYLWVLCNPRLHTEERTFYIYEPNQTIHNDFMGRFINTVQINNGDLVLHVFDKLK